MEAQDILSTMSFENMDDDFFMTYQDFFLDGLPIYNINKLGKLVLSEWFSLLHVRGELSDIDKLMRFGGSLKDSRHNDFELYHYMDVPDEYAPNAQDGLIYLITDKNITIDSDYFIKQQIPAGYRIGMLRTPDPFVFKSGDAIYLGEKNVDASIHVDAGDVVNLHKDFVGDITFYRRRQFDQYYTFGEVYRSQYTINQLSDYHRKGYYFFGFEVEHFVPLPVDYHVENDVYGCIDSTYGEFFIADGIIAAPTGLKIVIGGTVGIGTTVGHDIVEDYPEDITLDKQPDYNVSFNLNVDDTFYITDNDELELVKSPDYSQSFDLISDDSFYLTDNDELTLDKQPDYNASLDLVNEPIIWSGIVTKGNPPELTYFVVNADSGRIVHAGWINYETGKLKSVILDSPVINTEEIKSIILETPNIVIGYDLSVATKSFYFTSNGRNEISNTVLNANELIQLYDENGNPVIDELTISMYDGTQPVAYMLSDGNMEAVPSNEYLTNDNGALKLQFDDVSGFSAWCVSVERKYTLSFINTTLPEISITMPPTEFGYTGTVVILPTITGEYISNGIIYRPVSWNIGNFGDSYTLTRDVIAKLVFESSGYIIGGVVSENEDQIIVSSSIQGLAEKGGYAYSDGTLIDMNWNFGGLVEEFNGFSISIGGVLTSTSDSTWSVNELGGIIESDS